MDKTHDGLAASPPRKAAIEASLGRDNLLSIFESSVGPGAFVFSLWALAFYFEGEVNAQYLILSVIVFALAYPGLLKLQAPVPTVLVDVLLNWVWIAGMLLATGWVTGYIREFSIQVIGAWLWLAPLTELSAYFVLRRAGPSLLTLQGPKRRAIIVGMNKQGLALAEQISTAPYSRIELAGFVDSRSNDRLNSTSAQPLLGAPEQLPALVRDRHIQLIYLSLPMASQPRILQILDELKDTTASIYFVPDMFVTDLIQGHTSMVCATPVISVCETPFKGSEGAAKRASDIVLSLLILIMISPLLLGIAAAVKLTSPGNAIFKQRRYGLDGEEIVVYKFRSMTVTEDGGTIQQATRNDSRITPLGAFLRKTSLDELPQFINVLQGRMSIVGPRPHAVAHNELYRKLIKGYMVRHKVKPGITGLAQVSGFRGETDTLDKMQGRIDFDLQYLRNWSLGLDLRIIFKTIRMVVKDQSAY
jgi:putative colanic acid biosysnthesis UDP-glucose lipid carrier transferase